MALNLVTVGLSTPLEPTLDACVRLGIKAVALWTQNYRGMGSRVASQMVRDRGLAVTGICRMSGFGEATDDSSWRDAIDDAHQLIDDAAEFRAGSITVIGGGMPKNCGTILDTRERILKGVKIVASHAREVGVTLALEPLHPMVAAERGAISTLEYASSLARECGSGVGVMVDSYNVWWDPALHASIASANGLIAGYQVSDWLVPTTDLAFDRGMMGDGVIDLRGIRSRVEAAGYKGYVEVEILSHKISALAIDDLISLVKERFTEFA
ncbi:sugar phosphate isomerase/epimerase family protein [Pararobbsia alpina]|nr:sugar phosphate isomerase/epimerase family protein [Pararobbsia alpina]